MRAVIAQDKKPVITTLPDPIPAERQILIDAKATALNRADLLQVKGAYPPPPGEPETLGLEVAGVVMEVGAGVTEFAVGQRVMALLGGGGYAEKVVVTAETVMPIPEKLSFEDAAAVPEAFLTAYSNMVEIGDLQAGQRVLIHAGASGVGLAAIQIAKVLGATVIVTASASKHDICKALGADMTIDYKTENFAERILAHFSGVHLIVDMVGAPYWEDNLRVIEEWGRIVYVGLQGGAQVNLNLGMVMQKRLTITGSTLRTRTLARKAALVSNFTAWMLPHFETGALKPNIWRVMRLEQVEEAHALMRDNANAGKIVLMI
ncbi:MAG: NAD(P)H-quinone oxidoreductase [Anaerolineae bacterium]